jgi:predicted DNA-binding protein (MmcQ/YjbR family)
MTMRWRTLRKRCLSLEGAEETFPFGTETSVFKVGGKIFALSRLHAEPLSVSVKCEPLLAEQLRAAHPAITAGYHLNKRHWNTIVIDGSLPDAMMTDMIEDSYDLVVSKLPRARQVSLGWGLASTGKDSHDSADAPRFGSRPDR